jgi:hypothetical protein
MSIVTYNNRSIANISAIPGAAKSLTHIKTVTASSSSTLSFVDGSSDVVLDSTYPIYLFKFINMHPATNDIHFSVNFSTDSGSNYNVTKTTTYFRARHKEDDSFTELAYSTVFDVAQATGEAYIFDSVANDNDGSWSGEFYLFNPSSTTFVKHFISRIQGVSSTPLSNNVYSAGYGNTTSAIDGVRFKMSSGNIDAGTIKLYGIKDS